jgi:hypothetical protein
MPATSTVNSSKVARWLSSFLPGDKLYPLPGLDARGQPATKSHVVKLGVGGGSSVARVTGRSRSGLKSAARFPRYFPFLSPCQIPERSGLPSGFRGAGAARSALPSLIRGKLEVDEAVGICFEDEPPRVAALGDMVRNVGGDHSCQASHQSGGGTSGRGISQTFRLFECIRTEMEKGSPEGYNAETGLREPAQKPQTGEPHERQPLYWIRCPQEKRQLLREDRRRSDRRGKQTAGDAPSASRVGSAAQGKWPFVVIREQVREGRDSVGRKLIDVLGYTFRVFVTSCPDPPTRAIFDP